MHKLASQILVFVLAAGISTITLGATIA